MSTNYGKHFSTVSTPQSEPIPGQNQVQNNAGGYVYSVVDWARLDRFLILGSEGGSYYATEKKLTIDNAQCVLRCAKADGKRTVARIVEISEAGRAPKNAPAVFALAICAGQIGTEAATAALEALPKVCRIGTDLFAFVEAVQNFRGWGNALQRAVREWYCGKEKGKLAYQLVKYQNRDGWTHKDVIRLSDLKSNTADIRWTLGMDLGPREVKRYKKVTGGTKELIRTDTYPGVTDELSSIIQGFEQAKKASDKHEIAKLIRDFNLPRECVPTQFLKDVEVWDALLEKMPLTAMIRNLANMTRSGLLTSMSNGTSKVLTSLINEEYIRKSRVHPVTILMALKTYASGHGDKGGNTWIPVPQIIDALDGAFYRAFGNVEPTGKRFLFGLDVSGSMGSHVAGTSMTCCEGATAMALVTAHVEPMYHIMAFADDFRKLPISAKSRLDDALKHTRNVNFGGTDCALPMTYATQHNIPVDVFIAITDNETWAGSVHPSQALQAYRQKTGINAKEVVVGMTSTNFTIADPNDPGTLDCVGFDSSTPQVISEFSRS